jgi:hypothetical protein
MKRIALLLIVDFFPVPPHWMDVHEAPEDLPFRLTTVAL